MKELDAVAASTYDDPVLALYRVVTPETRALIGENARRVLIPYVVRSPFLVLEERSEVSCVGAFGWKRVETPRGVRFHLLWV